MSNPSTENINPDLVQFARPIRGLKPDPRNARRHDEASIDAIATSLKRFGQQKTIVLKGKTVVAGNGTLIAAQKLGWKKIAAVEYDGTEDSAAYALADNRTAEMSEWDHVALKNAVVELTDNETDLGLEGLGFEELLEASPAVAGFLDEFIEEKGKTNAIDKEVPAALRLSVEHVNFSCSLDTEQNKVVWDAIRHARTLGDGSVQEAIMFIAKKSLETYGPVVKA